MGESIVPQHRSRFWRKTYHALGFSKGYNFVLWFLCLGYLLGFTLARLMYLNFYGIFCSPQSGPDGAAPGECYYYLRNPWQIGMKLHLYAILPAAVLVCLQFTPAIRQRYRMLHRINGYIVVLLCLVSNAGALIIAQVAFGGSFNERMMSGTLVVLTTLALLMAYVNIKFFQIDQHRAWMIRAWAIFSTIITIRIIMIISAQIISAMGGFFTTRPCAQITSIFGKSRTLTLYPICAAYFDGTNPTQRAIVEADFSSANPVAIVASLAIPFGAAGWLALVLHTLAAEIYLRLTPNESLRLRQVSYERQLAHGFARPGYAGLTAERFGDAPAFVPPHGEDIEETIDDPSKV